MRVQQHGAGFTETLRGHGLGVWAIAGVGVDALDLSAAVAEDYVRRVGLTCGGAGPMIEDGDRAVLLVEAGVGFLLSLRLGPYLRRADIRVVEPGRVIELPSSSGASWHSSVRRVCAPRGREVVPVLARACTAATEAMRASRGG